MNTLTKRVLLTTAILSVLGVMLLAIGIVTGGLSFLGSPAAEAFGSSGSFSGQLYQKEKMPLDDFSALNIDVIDMEVLVLPSEDDGCYMSYSVYGSGKTDPLQYTLQNGTLSIKEDHSGESGFFVGIDYHFLAGLLTGSLRTEEAPVPVDQVILYIPAGVSLSHTTISTGDGDVILNGVTGGQLTAESSYGDLTVTDGTFSSTELTLGDGDLTLENVTSAQSVIDNTYGDVTARNSSLGKVTFQSGDGDLHCSGTTFSGDCTFNLSYGDASFQLTESQAAKLSMELTTDYGDIELSHSLAADGAVTRYEDEDVSSYRQTGTSPENVLRVHCDDGDIVLK